MGTGQNLAAEGAAGKHYVKAGKAGGGPAPPARGGARRGGAGEVSFASLWKAERTTTTRVENRWRARPTGAKS
jgi:hypothetical protein